MKINLCPRGESVSNLPESLDIVLKIEQKGAMCEVQRFGEQPQFVTYKVT